MSNKRQLVPVHTQNSLQGNKLNFSLSVPPENIKTAVKGIVNKYLRKSRDNTRISNEDLEKMRKQSWSGNYNKHGPITSMRQSEIHHLLYGVKRNKNIPPPLPKRREHMASPNPYLIFNSIRNKNNRNTIKNKTNKTNKTNTQKAGHIYATIKNINNERNQHHHHYLFIDVVTDSKKNSSNA